jgi:hypothetical protein
MGTTQHYVVDICGTRKWEKITEAIKTWILDHVAAQGWVLVSAQADFFKPSVINAKGKQTRIAASGWLLSYDDGWVYNNAV